MPWSESIRAHQRFWNNLFGAAIIAAYLAVSWLITGQVPRSSVAFGLSILPAVDLAGWLADRYHWLRMVRLVLFVPFFLVFEFVILRLLGLLGYPA
jgi:hypothetical protein